MKRNIEDLVVDLCKNNQGRPLKFPIRKMRNILQQSKLLLEEMGNLHKKSNGQSRHSTIH